ATASPTTRTRSLANRSCRVVTGAPSGILTARSGGPTNPALCGIGPSRSARASAPVRTARTRVRARAARVSIDSIRACVRRTHENGVAQPGRRQVVDKRAAAGQQPQILLAPDRPADAVLHPLGNVHLLLSMRRTTAAVASQRGPLPS